MSLRVKLTKLSTYSASDRNKLFLVVAYIFIRSTDFIPQAVFFEVCVFCGIFFRVSEQLLTSQDDVDVSLMAK